MDNSTRINVISAAVIAAGPVGEDRSAWQAQVQENAVNIAVMASDTSQIAKALASIENAKVFSGTVVSVKKETSSTRGVITLNTGTDRAKEGVAEGCEQVRTERTDNIMGRNMALKMRDLIGHRVLVWVEVEEYNNGAGKVRVLKHVEDLGVDLTVAQTG